MPTTAEMLFSHYTKLVYSTIRGYDFTSCFTHWRVPDGAGDKEMVDTQIRERKGGIQTMGQR